MKTYILNISANASNTSKVLEFVENSLTEAQVSIAIVQKSLVCTDEIYANISMYSGATEVEVRCIISETKVHLEFKDDGRPYNPLEVPAPDITLSSDKRDIGGNGIHIVKKLMNEVVYRYEDHRNILGMVIGR